MKVHLGRRERLPGRGENVISRLEQVLEVAVIGVPDARWGETGAAYVVVE